MFRTLIFTAASAVFLVACDETSTTAVSSTPVDPITAAIAGKTLVAGDAVFKNAKDGTVTGVLGDGTKYKGSWVVQDGKLCTDFTEPAEFLGFSCQNATLGGDGTITIDSRNGGPITWTIK